MSEGNTLLSREVTIKSKKNNSGYFAKNILLIEAKAQRLGGSISAANSIKSQSILLQKVMPVLTGVNPSDSKWHIHLAGYLDSITVLVNQNGKKLNTSLQFQTVEDYTSFNKSYNDINTAYTTSVKANPNTEARAFEIREEKLLNLEEVALTKSFPININDYFTWRYAMVHPDVANREIDKDKSTKIRFFIYDIVERKQKEKELFEIRSKASKLYFDLVGKLPVVNSILRLITRELNAKVDLTILDETDKKKLLFDYANNNPLLFITIANDENLEVKSLIEEYITMGIFNRPINSNMIINSENQDIIGNNINDAIVYFKNKDNSLSLKRFNEKLNSQVK
jgi:hypothetical protein